MTSDVSIFLLFYKGLFQFFWSSVSLFLVCTKKLVDYLLLLASGLPASNLHLSRELFIRTSPKFRIRLSPQGAFLYYMFKVCFHWSSVSRFQWVFQICSGLRSRRNDFVCLKLRSPFFFAKLIAIRQFSCCWVRKFLFRGMFGPLEYDARVRPNGTGRSRLLWGFDSLRCVSPHSVCFLCLVCWPLRINSA